MNFARLKGLVWLAAFVVGGTLVYDVTDFLRRRGELEQYVPTETLERVLNDVEQPEPPREELVAYNQVLQVFKEQNWTGKEVRKVVTTNPNVQQPVRKTPVSELLKVIVLQVDTVDPAGSLAYVHFTDPKLASRAKEHKDRILRVGTKLFPPYDYVQVDAITVEGVRFVFTNDAAREAEVVTSEEYDMQGRPGIVVVDNAVMPKQPRRIGEVASPKPYNPRRTEQFRRNEFQVGRDDVAELNEDYTRILSQDLRYRTHRGPDGNVDGIQITSVSPDSLPARHGITSGEVVKSINGHAVKSVNEAIAYVKQEAKTTDVWVVVFEKQGREFTRTYHSPK